MARCHECRTLIVEIATEGRNNDANTDVDAADIRPVAPVETAKSTATSSAAESRGHPPVQQDPTTRPNNKAQRQGPTTMPGKASARPQSPVFEPRKGLQIGRYTLLYPLGQGGMGSVFAALDPKLDRRVALKFLRTDLQGPGDQAHRRRLVREARALARLSHPNVVSIYDVVESDHSVFLAMELIDGTNARVWRDLGERSPEQISKVYSEALLALIAAHEQGIVHRDFKPDNVMVGADGIARVTDFGLAREADFYVEHRSTERGDTCAPWDTLTQTGMIMGTPRYMAPEQFRGVANERSDQFSFCLSMYEALCGHYPLGTTTAGELLPERPTSEQLLSPLKRFQAPECIRTILIKGMAVIPEERWRDAAELHYELSRALSPRPLKWKWASALAVGLTIASVAFYLAPSPPALKRANTDFTEYAARIRRFEHRLDKSRSVLVELAAAKRTIRELRDAMEYRESELELEQLLKANAALKRATKRKMKLSPLPTRSIERSVTTHLAEVLACYQSKIAKDEPETIKVRVGVDSDGVVQWVHRPYSGDQDASQCLARALKRLSFPPSETATSATLFLSFFHLESGLLALSMRSTTRRAFPGQVTVDAKGRLLVDCPLDEPLCGLEPPK